MRPPRKEFRDFLSLLKRNNVLLDGGPVSVSQINIPFPLREFEKHADLLSGLGTALVFKHSL